jgi:hypothetical protein
MRGAEESDLDYWERRRRETLALAQVVDGDLRDAHLALAESYSRLIEIKRAAEVKDLAE